MIEDRATQLIDRIFIILGTEPNKENAKLTLEELRLLYSLLISICSDNVKQRMIRDAQD